MKKNPILLLALSAICAGCTAVAPTTSSDSSVDESSNLTPSSDVVSSENEDSSEESSESPAVTIDDIVAAAAKADITKIAGGKLTTTVEDMWSDEGGDVTVSDYDYGDGVFHTTGSDWSGDYDLYLVYDTDGSIVAIKRDSENTLSKDTVSYDVAALPFNNYLGYGSSAYGAEGFATALAATAKTDPNGDLKVSYSNDAYNFSFGYLLSSWYYYTVNVSFVIDDGALTNVNAEIIQYGSDAFVTDDENGTTSLVEDASFEKRSLYVVEQTVGDRTFVNPYDLDDFAATSYNLVDVDGAAVTDTFTMEAGDYTKVKMTSIAPSTANLEFDTPKITVSEPSGLSVSFANYDGPTLYFDASSVGSYQVEIKTRKITKTLTVVVEAPKPSAITASCYTVSPDGYAWAGINNNTMSGYTGATYYLCPSVEPYSASQDVNASVGAEVDACSIVKTDIYTYEGSTTPVVTYAFTANKAGSYPVTFVSAVNEEVSYTVVINVVEAPSFKDFLGVDSGFASRENGPVKYTFNFDPTNDAGTSGNVAIKDVQNNKSETATYAIAKNETTGLYDFTITHVSGDELSSSLSLKLTTDFTLYVVTSVDGYVSSSALSVANPKFFLVQNWKAVSNDLTFTARFWENGSVELKMFDSDYYANYYYSASYTIADAATSGGYAVTISTGDASQPDSPFFDLPATFYLSSDFSTLSASFTCDSVDYTFSLAFANAGRGE